MINQPPLFSFGKCPKPKGETEYLLWIEDSLLLIQYCHPILGRYVNNVWIDRNGETIEHSKLKVIGWMRVPEPIDLEDYELDE